MGSNLWAGETLNTLRIPSASGKETATAKFLTSEHAWRGGDGGMCSFWRGEFLDRFSSWVNLLKHPQKWHIRPFCPRALKNKKFKWSFVHHTQNSLFQKHFQWFFFYSLRFLVPRIFPCYWTFCPTSSQSVTFSVQWRDPGMISEGAWAS